MTRVVWTRQAVEDVEAFADETLREIVHGAYRLVYRVRADAVEILTVYHGARMLRL